MLTTVARFYPHPSIWSRIMNNQVNIGEIIRLEFEKTGWSVSRFAEMIGKDRTVVYHIFRRKTIDTALLYDISMVLNVDFFQFYSGQLSADNEIIRQRQPDNGSRPVPAVEKRKVWMEVELAEEEYRRFLENYLSP